MGQTFDQHVIGETRERLAQLLGETDTETYESKEHVERFIQELSSGLEELMVAEEELRVQGEELAASGAAIDAERERYGELFEFAPDAYLVTDDQGQILEANGAASQMLGVPVRYLAGKLMAGFVDEAARRDLRELLHAVNASDEPVGDRYLQIKPRDGAVFTAEVRVVRTTKTDAAVLRWMVRDITQRLRLEADIRFLHSEVELLASLNQVARLTTEPAPVEDMLDRVVDLAARALNDCEVSVAVAVTDKPRFAASSGDRGRRLDAAEGEQGDGPCLTALRADAIVRTSVDEAVAQWPVFGAAAKELGLVEAVGHAVTTPGGQRGALNVYAFSPLSDEACAFIPLVADQVAVALANAELYESAHSLAGHLQRALESRGVIEQAKGVLIARQGCTDEQAFDILRRASQRLNRKLRDVAAELVAHVQAPKPEGGSDANPEMEASIARARGREMRARDRADEEKVRAEEARKSGVRAQQQAAAAHERARVLHERAAALQRRHQVELEEGETNPAPMPPPFDHQV